MFEKRFIELLKNKSSVEDLAHEYTQGKPFPHIILENVFTERALYDILAGFPKPDDRWWHYDNVLERKFAKDDLTDESSEIREAVCLLQSKLFVDFLEKLSGIKGLIVDHTLRGGGLHQIARGGKLDIHKDYSVHPVTKLDRRLNVILYLNPRWKPEWGGHLDLWASENGRLTQCQATISPQLGRMVIFNTTGDAYHGHPDPLNCPEGVTRKSIAVYYYTSPAEIQDRKGHSTIYMKRPEDPDDASTEALRQRRAQGRIQKKEETI